MATDAYRSPIPARAPGGRPRKWAPTPAGAAIERAAARRGMGLQDVANAAGITLQSLYAIVSGKTADPRLSVAQAIAAALGTRVDRLFRPPSQRQPTNAAR
ncbi:MAG: XRE family transcriptional regulator [Planctomycetia bacterium]|nr:XRE family transcriptional regulator [Planctomycetia bacterium]